MKVVKLWVLVLGLGWGLVCWGQPSGSVDPGEEYFQRGQFEQAAEVWEKRLMELSPTNSPEEYVDVSVQLAVAYQSLGQLKQALKVLRDAADKTNDSVQLAKVLIQLGEVFLAMPDKSPTKNQSNEDDYAIAVQACNSTTVKRNVDKAGDCLEVAIKKVGNDNWLKATAKNSLGNVLVAQQKYCEAVSQYEESISSANKAGDNLLAVNTSINLIQSLAIAMQKNCQVTQKLDHDTVLQQVNKLPPSHDKAFALISLAKLAKDLLPVSSREQALREALTIAEGLNDKSALVYAKLYLADLCLSGEKKTDCYSKSIDLLKGAIDNDAQSYPKINIEQGRITNADSFVSDSFGVYWPPSSNVTPEQEKCKEVCKVYSSPCVQDKLPKECKEVCRDVTPLFLRDYHPELSFQLAWQLGKVYKAQSETEKELDAKTLEQSQKTLDDHGQKRLQMAIDAKGREQLQKAISAYDNAANYLQMVRRTYGGISQLFGSKVEDFAMELVDLLIQAAKTEHSQEKQQVFLKKAVAGMELLKKTELQNYFRDECLGEKQPNQAKTSDEVLSLLPASIAVLYPIWFENSENKRIVLLLVSNKGIELLEPEKNGSEIKLNDEIDGLLNDIKTVETETSQKSVLARLQPPKNSDSTSTSTRSINEFHTTQKSVLARLQSQKNSDFPSTRSINELHTKSLSEFKLHAEKLYQWLIEPVTNKLNKDTLVIVPTGILRKIPFAALYNQTTGHYLIQDYALAVVPGLTLTDFKSAPLAKVQGLLNGLSVAKEQFPALKAKEELEQIVNVPMWIGVPKRLEDNKFTLSEVSNALKDENNSYDIVHFATHGQFRSDPEQTFLLTYDYPDKKLTLDELEKMMSVSVLRNKPVKLLTLSACQSALGDERMALGLTGIAVKVGVSSAVGTLWLVSNDATPQLVVNFYHQLAKGLPKAKALQLAMRAFIECSQSTDSPQKELLRCDLLAKDFNKERYQHPYYWAALVLVGNPFPL